MVLAGGRWVEWSGKTESGRHRSRQEVKHVYKLYSDYFRLRKGTFDSSGVSVEVAILLAVPYCRVVFCCCFGGKIGGGGGRNARPRANPLSTPQSPLRLPPPIQRSASAKMSVLSLMIEQFDRGHFLEGRDGRGSWLKKHFHSPPSSPFRSGQGNEHPTARQVWLCIHNPDKSKEKSAIKDFTATRDTRCWSAHRHVLEDVSVWWIMRTQWEKIRFPVEDVLLVN